MNSWEGLEKKKFFALPGTEALFLGCPARSLFIVTTAVSQLQVSCVLSQNITLLLSSTIFSNDHSRRPPLRQRNNEGKRKMNRSNKAIKEEINID
jgi:hypothetical protein